MRGAVEFECEVVAVPARRGPASEAVRCYWKPRQAVRAARRIRERMKSRPEPARDPTSDPIRRARAQLRRLRGRI